MKCDGDFYLLTYYMTLAFISKIIAMPCTLRFIYRRSGTFYGRIIAMDVIKQELAI